MKKLAIALIMMACGGKPAAPTANVSHEPAGSAAPKAEQCCCELPSDPSTYEMHDKEDCQTDAHGVCSDAAKCVK